MFSRDVSTFRGVAQRSSALAFRDADYACAIEAHRVPFWEKAAGVVLAVFIGVSLACVLVAGLS